MCRIISNPVCRVVVALMVVAFFANDMPLKAEGQPAAPVPELVAGNSAFAFDLYANLTKAHANENLVFSPYSVSLALGMAYAGAGGDTAKEMEHVLHITMSADEVHRSFAALQARQKAVFAPKGYELHIANSLWGQKGFPFRTAYFNLTREKYGAALEEIDFRADPEKARQRINAWVAQQTKNKITDLVRKAAIDKDTRLVLANAIYLKGAWAKQFSKSLTQKDFFRIDPDTRTPILMMSEHGHFRYFADDELQYLELPIGTGGVAMGILLPKQVDGLAKVERSLTHQRLQKLRMHMQTESVTVQLPRFKIDSERDLTKSLKDLGISSAFAMDQADFSKMAGGPGVVLKAVAHKAYLNVDETGLEAAAATAVAGKEGATAPPKIVFRADHPFFFVIRESSSGSILFMGRVQNPGGQEKVMVNPARAAVDRAIRAHGGKEGLSRLRIAEVGFDMKGTEFPILAGRKLESFDFKVSEVYNLPHQIKKTIQGKAREFGMPNEEEFMLTWAINGDQVWLRQGMGKVELMKRAALVAEEQYRPLQIFEMLARHNVYDWTTTDDIPADRSKVIPVLGRDPQRAGTETIFLFNKTTGLLEGTRVVRMLPNMPNPVVGEVVYSDYREIDGVQLPMHKTIAMDGKKIAEIRIAYVRFLDSIDRNRFEPPANQEPQPGEIPKELKAYLTPEGQLKERLILRDEGGIAGRGTGVRWEIEVDGAWRHVARNGSNFTTTEGRLDAKQRITLATELARFDLLNLPREVRKDPAVVVADGFNVAILFGKQHWTFLAARGFADLPAVNQNTAPGRFAGIARAIQASVGERSSKKSK